MIYRNHGTHGFGFQFDSATVKRRLFEIKDPAPIVAIVSLLRIGRPQKWILLIDIHTSSIVLRIIDVDLNALNVLGVPPDRDRITIILRLRGAAAGDLRDAKLEVMLVMVVQEMPVRRVVNSNQALIDSVVCKPQ